MPDNVTVDNGTLTDYTVASDETASGQVQLMKLAYSGDGLDTLVTADAGGLLVNLGTNNDVTVTGTVTANAGTNLNTSALALESGGNLAAAATSLGVLDDWDESDRAKVNPIVGQAGVQGGAGTATATTQRVALATDANSVTIGGPGTIDSFGHVITGDINNAVDVQFYRDTPQNLVTVTSGTGGTASSTNGMATFACTTSANSFAKGVTGTSTYYTAGAEVYALFTAGFTGTGAGTSYQRIGLYDTNNGFFIGYEGGTFGVTVRKGGSDVQVAKASWNGDTLTGAVGSKFTRGGTPEAVVLTNLNVWRIRFGWVGSAPIKFEILSPDGEWVTVHTIRQPNNAALPSINNADLPVTCDVNGGNSGAALTIITNCWAAGVTQRLQKINQTITSATLADLTRAVITGETTAGGGGFVNVKVNPSGALVTAGGAAAASTGAASQATISNSSGTVVASRAARVALLITNQQAVPVYIDPSGGTATTSMFRLDPGASLSLETTSAVTGITSAAYTPVGDAKVHVLETY